MYAVPRRDFFPIPAAPPESSSRHPAERADETGRLLLYVGMTVILLLGVLAFLTDAWAYYFAEKIFESHSPTTAAWIQRIGIAFLGVFAIRGAASVLGWRSGRYFYRNFRF